MVKDVIRKIRKEVLELENEKFKIVDKEVEIKFDFPKESFFDTYKLFASQTNHMPFYFDRDVILPIYRDMIKTNKIIDGEYRIPMYKENPFKDIITLKEDVPFYKYEDIRIMKGIPYILDEDSNTVRPLKHTVTRHEKRSIGYLLVSIKSSEEEKFFINK